MAKIDELEPVFRIKIQSILEGIERVTNTKWILTSTYRSIAEQDKLYAQSRTTPGPRVTNAKGGQSPHNFRLAADFCPLNSHGNCWWDCPANYWTMLAELAEGLGLVSGLHFKSIRDNPHVEDPRWKGEQTKWINAGKPV